MLITVFAIIFVVIVSIIFVIIVFIIIVIILAFVIIVLNNNIRCGAPVEQCEKLWWLAPTTSFLEKANHLIIHFIFFKLI